MSTANHKTPQQHVITCTVHVLYNHIACSCTTIKLRNIPFFLSIMCCVYIQHLWMLHSMFKVRNFTAFTIVYVTVNYFKQPMAVS